jgi:hypothetical protein
MTPTIAIRDHELNTCHAMIENVWFVAATWMALALAASLISIWTGISVALFEILVGVAAGNLLHLRANTEWINFLALLGANFSSPGQRGDSRDPILLSAIFFRRDLQGTIPHVHEKLGLSNAGKLTVLGIIGTAGTLLFCSACGRPLGEQMCITTFAVTLAVTFFDREAPWAVSRRVAWSALPLGAGDGGRL